MKFIESFLDIFMYKTSFFNFEFLNLHNYFPGTVGNEYILVFFLTSILYIITITTIGLVFFRLGLLLNKYFHIKTKGASFNIFFIILSIIFGLFYPIYCFIVGARGGKMTKQSLKYIIFTQLTVGILFFIFILKINGII